MHVSKESIALKQRLNASQQKVQQLERSIRILHYKYTAAIEGLRLTKHYAEMEECLLIIEAVNDTLEVIENAKAE